MAQTWTQTDTAADHSGLKCYSGNSLAASPYYRECAVGGTPGSSNIAVELSPASTEVAFIFEGDQGLGVGSIPSGTWTVYLYNAVAQADADVVRIDLCLVDSSGASQGTIGTWTGTTNLGTTGSKQFDISGSEVSSCDTTDRFYIQVHCQNSHSKQPRTVTLTPSQTVVDTISSGTTWDLAGSISSTVTVAGDLTVNHATWTLEGSISVTATVAGTLSLTQALAGSVSAAVSVSGDLTVSSATSTIRIPRRQTFPDQRNSYIDPAHPLARQLVALWIPNISRPPLAADGYALANGASQRHYPVPVKGLHGRYYNTVRDLLRLNQFRATFRVLPTDRGPAFHSGWTTENTALQTRAASEAIWTPYAPGEGSTGAFTIATRCRKNSSNAWDPIFDISETGSLTFQPEIEFDVDSDGTNKLGLYWGGATPQAVYSGLSPSIGVWLDLVITSSAGDKIQFYVDGKFISETSITGNTYGAGPWRFMIGSAGGEGTAFSLTYAAHWHRVLTAAEVESLHRDPFEMLQEVRTLSVSAGPTTHQLQGTVSATVTLAGDLKVTRKLAGSVAAQATINGNLQAKRQLSGSVSASATLSGDLRAIRGLAGSVAAVSATSGNLRAIRGLAGTVSGETSITGDLRVTRRLQGAISAQATVTGNLEISGTVSLEGAVAAQATVAGDLKVTRKLAGAVAAQTSVTGALRLTQALAGSVAAQTTVTGDLTVLEGVWSLEGHVSAQATITGDLKVTRKLAGAVAAQTSVTGALRLTQALAGSVAAQVTITGDLTIPSGTWALEGAIAAAASISGNLHVTRALVGSVAAQSTVSGNLTRLLAMAGSVSIGTSLEGDLHIIRALVGSISATSQAAGNLTVTRALAGAVQVTASVEASLSLHQALMGAIAAVCSVVGNLRQIFAGEFPVQKLHVDVTETVLEARTKAVDLEAETAVPYLEVDVQDIERVS